MGSTGDHMDIKLVLCLALSVLHCAAVQVTSLDDTPGTDSPLSYKNSVKNAEESLAAANQALRLEMQNHGSSRVDYQPAMQAQQEAQAAVDKLKSMKDKHTQDKREQSLMSDNFLKQVEEKIENDIEKKVEGDVVKKIEAKVETDMQMNKAQVQPTATPDATKKVLDQPIVQEFVQKSLLEKSRVPTAAQLKNDEDAVQKALANVEEVELGASGKE